MIRRDAGSDWILIRQDDHARLAGELAGHLGNGEFDRPESFDAFLSAVQLHDSGWPMHDDAPTLNPAGQPTDVFEIPREIALKIWRASVDRAAEAGPLAEMFVSLHVTALSSFAARHTPRDPDHFDPADAISRFSFQKFQQYEFERQENLRRQLNLRSDLPLTNGLADAGLDARDDMLRFAFRMLQAMDAISLAACCTRPPFPLLKDVPPRPDASPLSIELIRWGEDVIARPWMFDVEVIDVMIPCRRIAKASFKDAGSFAAVYKDAPLTSVVGHVRRRV